MKKIILPLLLCGIAILVLIGCGNKNTNDLEKQIKEEFNGIYTIESGEVVYGRYNSDYIREMNADGMKFYVYKYTWGNGLSPYTEIYSSILSSVYEKYKNEIMSLGNKYNLDVTFNLTADSYSNYIYFDDSAICDSFITIEASSSQMDSIRNFVDDVMSIEEIKNLYNLHSAFVYDYSKIIINEDADYTSIFNFYKNCN